MKKIIILLLAGMLVGVTAAFGAAGDDIIGRWSNAEKDAKIEIFHCGEKYCGKIVWLKTPDYPVGSREGTPGTPKIDIHNPDPALQSRPIIGLLIVKDFVYGGDSLWKDGTVYDPKVGKTYHGKMTLKSPHQLDLRGFIGISLFGRTTSWTR